MTNNINTLNEQRLSELAKKYNLVNYTPGQSFDSIKDSMTKEDYDVSQKLLDYYLNQQNLNNDYKNNMNQINQNQSKLLQENAISKEMSSKYLPEYLKMQGLGGLGLSESSIVSANNNYRNQRNTINANADSQKADLLKNYQASVNTLDQNALSESDDIRKKYQVERDNEALEKYNSYLEMLNNNEFESEESLQKWYDSIKGTLTEDKQSLISNKVENYKQGLKSQEAEQLYNHLVEKINYGEFNTSEELENSYNEIKDKLNESQKSMLEDRINYYKKNPEQQEIDKETQQKEVESVVSGKKYISFNGQDYQITSEPLDKDDVELEDLYEAANQLWGKSPYEVENGTSVSYADLQKYAYINRYGEDSYKQNTLLQMSVNNLTKEKDLNLTYFNGEWYVSTKR